MTSRAGTEQQVRHHGFWWRVGEPERKVQGVLTSDAEGKLSLELFGAFGESNLSFLSLPEGQFRIVGETDEGPATLEHCFARTARGTWEQPRQLWHVGEALIGAMLPEDAPWQFYGCQYSIPGLTRWVDRKSPEPFMDWDDQKQPRRAGVAVDVKQWPLWTLHDGVPVHLGRGFSTRSIGEYSAAVDAEVIACVHGTTLRSPDALGDAVSTPLRVLLTLATGKFTSPVRGKAILEPHEAGTHRPLVEWRWVPQGTQVNVLKQEYAFTLDDCMALGADALQNWFARAGQLSHALPLYMAAVKEGSYAEQSFLMTVQALEAYHRTDSEDRQNLRVRIQQLLSRTGGFEPRISGGDVEVFMDRVMNTRNFYTHWSADLRAKALRGEQAVYLTQRLLALLEMQLLHDVGFGLDSKAHRAIDHRRLSWLGPVPRL